MAWERLKDMQQVVADQPAVARAVRSLPLYDVLELTLELLGQHDWPEFAQPEPLPPNVIRFRPVSVGSSVGCYGSLNEILSV
jgi:hypothetical protein